MRHVLLPVSILAWSLLCRPVSAQDARAGICDPALRTHPPTAQGFHLQTGFFPSVGQLRQRGGDDQIRYAAAIPGLRLFLTPSGVSFTASRMRPSPAAVREADGRRETEGRRDPEGSGLAVREGFRVDFTFVDANPHPVIEAYGRRTSMLNFYTGVDGRTEVPEYDHILYRALWPGIDLVLTIKDAQVQYEFTVHPGADPSRIAMRTVGGDHVAIDAHGACVTTTALGTLSESAPFSYQPALAGVRHVPSSFVHDGDVRRIHVDGHDPSRPLIIDPWVTYYGGSADDKCNAITTDQRGRIIFAGDAMSIDLPVTTGSYQDSAHGASDAFIAKFDNTGARLYATYMGGAGNEYAWAVAVGAAGDIAVTGETASTDFPVTAGAFATTKKTMNDFFVMKFDSAGVLKWSTFYGGAGEDRGYAIAVDSSRNIVVVGQTTSNNFPTSTGSFQKAWAGWDDAVIIKFTSLGKRIWGTYFGGTSGEKFTGVGIGAKDQICIGGRTWSADFPVTPGAFQSAQAGTTHGDDAVVVKMDSSGRRMWSTYLGGDDVDIANALTVDRNLNITIAGRTASKNLPITTGALQSAIAVGTDAFLASLDSSGAMRWCTYFGGGATDEAFGIAADTTGAVVAVGLTHSTNLPMSGGAYTTNRGGQEMFVLKLDSTGHHLWGSYFGGTGEDYATSVTIHRTTIYLSGRTMSTNINVYNSLHPKNYGSDGLVAMFTDAGVVPVELTAFSGVWDGGRVRLTWSTETEVSNAGFDIQRKIEGATDAWTSRGFVAGSGTTQQRNSYAFLDEVEPGAAPVLYRLRQVDWSGHEEFSPVVRMARDRSLRSLEITDIHPHPVVAGAQISFATADEGPVDVVLHDSAGRIARTLQQGTVLGVGFHSLPFVTGDLPPGVYHVIVRQGAHTAVRQLVVMK